MPGNYIQSLIDAGQLKQAIAELNRRTFDRDEERKLVRLLRTLEDVDHALNSEVLNLSEHGERVRRVGLELSALVRAHGVSGPVAATPRYTTDEEPGPNEAHDFEPVLEDDLRQIIRDEPARVVWVVGTGVPQGALKGTPSAPHTSWAGLLRSGLQRICALGKITAGQRDDYERLLGHDKLTSWLLVAEAVAQGLGAPEGGEFSRWLRDTVGEFEKHIADPAVLDALADHQRRGGLLATTNYDLLLENVTRLQPVTWRTPANVERALRGHEPQVLHLHGVWRSPDSIVLGIRSYDDVVHSPHARAVLTTLRTSHTFVFVGCGAGLSDPNLGSFLSWTATVYAGSEYRHFRLCRESELIALRREHPDEQRIFPLSYGNDHADLAPFLRSLLPSQRTPGQATILVPTAIAPLPTPIPPTTPVPSAPTRPRGTGTARGSGRPIPGPSIKGASSGFVPSPPASAQQTDIILDVPALVGRTRGEVDTILGSPEHCEDVNPARIGPGLKCTYRSEKVEIVFFADRDRADWITVNDLQEVEFSPRSIRRFGLPVLEPTDFSPNGIRWLRLPGLLEVLLWPGQNGRCHFLHVKAFSP